MATGWVFDERFLWHDTGTAAGTRQAGGWVEPGRPYEQPGPARRFRNLVEVSGLLADRLDVVPSRPATTEEILEVHERSYVERRRRHADPRGPAPVRALRPRRATHRPCRRSHRVPRSATKTDAGQRVVPTVPALRERLAEHRMDYPGGPSQPAFPTRNGTRQQPDNVRSRILDRGNELLAADGRSPIAHMTPHTPRRTFASILAVCDVPPRRAMYLLGHTDPELTLAVYQQILDLGKGSIEILEQALGCTLAEARAIFNGESPQPRVSGPNPEPATKKGPRRGPLARGGGLRTSRFAGNSQRPDDGTQTPRPSAWQSPRRLTIAPILRAAPRVTAVAGAAVIARIRVDPGGFSW
jgi:integrase-like protein